MATDLLLANIAKHISLTEEEKRDVSDLMIPGTIPKKAFVLQKGQMCRHINFVHSGLLRAFYLGEGGKESTIMFAVSDWWITDMYCFVNERPAMLHIQALDHSCILKLAKQDLDQLYERIPKFEKFFRILMQNAYIREQLRIIQNLSQPAEERYERFLTQYPHIAQHLTQRQIASYLGITPEFLSMIRANRSKR